MIPNSPLLIAITFDLDPDHYDSSTSSQYKENTPSWKGLEQGIPVILEALKNFQDTKGDSVKATWFVRADNQIKDLYRNSAAMFDKHRKMFEKLDNLGHEISWHPHLSKKEGKEWLQEDNEENIVLQLKNTYKEILNYNFNPKCIRIGGNYFSPIILKTISELGLLYDSTAMPGRKRDDNDRNFNWHCAMQSPYYPSEIDYRIPDSQQDNLLEIPLSMLPIKAEYDVEHYSRYVDLTFHNLLLNKPLEILLAHQPYLVTVSHPGVLMYGAKQKEHGLLNFTIKNLQKNVSHIINYCNYIRRPFYFVTMSTLGKKAKKRMHPK